MSKFLNPNIKIDGKGGRYCLDDKQIIDYFNNNTTIKEITDILGVSRSTIQRRLRKYGVKRPPKYTLDENVFSSFNKQSCYWAGFMAADAWGWIKS